MYVVRNDQPDVPFTIDAVVLDSEGEAVGNDRLNFSIQSSDSDVVSVALSDGGVSARSTGEIIGSFGAQFTVTTGDPSRISGGTIRFEGLTES